MYHLLVILLAAVVALASATAQVQSVQSYDLPGEGDPRLQQAIDAWLDGEELDPVTELAALGREGNVAARLLLWKLEHRVHTDLPELSREERYRLYRPPSERPMPKRWPETEEMRDLPFVVDWYEVAEEKDPQIWLHHARRMLAAGEREHVIFSNVRFSHFHPSLAEFFDEITTVDDYHKLNIWLVRWSAHAAARLFPDSAPRLWLEGWTGPPWGVDQEAAVRQAFGEKRVAALKFLRIRNMMTPRKVLGSYLIDRTHDRSAELWEWYEFFVKLEPATSVERRMSGSLLVAEARHGNYLTPLLDICEARCAQMLETCMYSGVMHAGGLASLSQLSSPLEAVISQDRWRKSLRARRDLLRGACQFLAFRNQEHARLGTRPKLPPGGCFAQLLED